MNDKWWENVDWENADATFVFPGTVHVSKPEPEKSYEEKEAEWLEVERQEAIRSLMEEQQEAFEEKAQETAAEVAHVLWTEISKSHYAGSRSCV